MLHKLLSVFLFALLLPSAGALRGSTPHRQGKHAEARGLQVHTELIIASLTGSRTAIEVDPASYTVAGLKIQIQFATSVPAYRPKLVYAGQELMDDCAILQDLGIADGDEITLVLNVGAPAPLANCRP